MTFSSIIQRSRKEGQKKTIRKFSLLHLEKKEMELFTTIALTANSINSKWH